jgi:hypothetical protein
VLGYDSAHGRHHRHDRGEITPVNSASLEQIEATLSERVEPAGEGAHACERLKSELERMDTFFVRGRKYAKAAERGDALPLCTTVAFEDVASLLHVLTQKRVLLLEQVQETPSSISMLAK